MTYNQLLQTLVKCFLDDRFQTIYAGRWDVWMVNNGHVEAYTHMILKTDDQLRAILEHAKEICETPLVKALK